MKSLVTDRDYASAVQAHGEQSTTDSLYPGENFGNLASYLWEPYQIRPPAIIGQTTATVRSDQAKHFAAFYRLGASAAENFQFLEAPSDLGRIENVISTVEPNDALENHSARTERQSKITREEGRLLFLRGNPSPEWLNRIGAQYNVDPEFFRRHLDLGTTIGRQNYFELPFLPSTMENMLSLRIITIGSRKAPNRRYPPTQNELEHLRQEARTSMKAYLDRISRGKDPELQLGDSIVRDISVHDSEHFSIEQNISIHILKAMAGWIGMIFL